MNFWRTASSEQVADEYLAPDVLSTVKEMKAVNFRRVPKMPVYGVAQPTSEVEHAHILLISTDPPTYLWGLNPCMI